MLLGVVGSSGQMEDHRVATLELREFPKDPSLVRELVVRKGGSNNDVFAQAITLFDPLTRRRTWPMPPDTALILQTWVQPGTSDSTRSETRVEDQLAAPDSLPSRTQRPPVE